MTRRALAIGLLVCSACAASRRGSTAIAPEPGASAPAPTQAPVRATPPGPADSAACKLGSARACNDWGVALLDGQGVPKDVDAAAATLARACDLGSAWGCFNYAFLQESGTGTPRDVRAALDLYESSCRAGVAMACNRAGLLLTDEEFERDLKQDADRGISLFEKGCNGSLPVACANAGLILGQVHPNEGKRVNELLRRGCEGDAALGCALYAERVALGIGESADASLAARTFEKACQLDTAVGCYFWGAALADEESGLDPDLGRAKELLGRSCKAGHQPACSVLGDLDD